MVCSDSECDNTINYALRLATQSYGGDRQNLILDAVVQVYTTHGRDQARRVVREIGGMPVDLDRELLGNIGRLTNYTVISKLLVDIETAISQSEFIDSEQVHILYERSFDIALNRVKFLVTIEEPLDILKVMTSLDAEA